MILELEAEVHSLMKRIKAGKPLVEFIKLCYLANQPPLLVGKHGLGKSQILEQSAEELGIDYICRDLSLMEPPDLVGMPKIDEETTRYLPPAFLPRTGKGLIVFEELNRCPSYMRSPCLQLLTARALNDYQLPKGWLPCAAINPAGGNYEVHELDNALLSRFVKVEVIPDRNEWLAWAGEEKLHPDILEYVSSDNKIFTDTSPRDWCMASAFLQKAGKVSEAILDVALAGVVGRERAMVFKGFKKGSMPLPTPMQLLKGYNDPNINYQRKVLAWKQNGQLDVLENLVYSMKVLFQDSDAYHVVADKKVGAKALLGFLTDLPSDLSMELAEFLTELGYAIPKE